MTKPNNHKEHHMFKPITRRVVALASVGAFAFGLTACGDSSDDAGSRASSQQSAGGQQGMRDFPGASGEVVSLSDDIAQVQSSMGGQATGQTAVTWNDDTTFTKQVSASLGEIKVGSCVMAMGQDGIATSVRIISTTGSDCTVGMGGGTGAGQGTPPERPSDAPTDLPSPPSGNRGPGGGAFGKVTAVTNAELTIQSSMPNQDAETSNTIKVNGSTTYTKQAKASADAVKVGVCIMAQGENDNTGTMTATTVQISDKVDGSCNTFGPGGGGAPGMPQGDAPDQES
jgi:hypothetical protein